MLENNEADTIVALATPPGRGSVGIIRISGPQTAKVSKAILGLLPSPRVASYLPFFDRDKSIIDKGIAIYFPSPHSFTGEDILELQGHGGSIVLDYLLKTLLKLDVRMAKPGEFSERAFINGKLDLVQLEAVADLINASSIQAAQSAVRSMQGQFSELINQLLSEFIELRIYIEALIDFSEEEIDFLIDKEIDERLNNLSIQIKAVLSNAKQGILLREGITIVIAGCPNVGKSSLLNCLTGQESAIVSDIPGTTRDLLREPIHIDGLPLHLIDTAGLRLSEDPIEQEGIRRAYKEINNADRILLVTDIDSQSAISEFKKTNDLTATFNDKITVICNKIDLNKKQAGIENMNDYPVIYLSTRTKEGIPLLFQHLKSIVGYSATSEGVFIARRRHIDALQRSQLHLHQGQLHTKSKLPCTELLAEELRLAQNALAEITGEFRTEDLLSEIFSSFCIGK